MDIGSIDDDEGKGNADAANTSSCDTCGPWDLGTQAHVLKPNLLSDFTQGMNAKLDAWLAEIDTVIEQEEHCLPFPETEYDDKRKTRLP